MSSGNLLAGAASPYLRQHAADPVHWHPWGDEAFARARAEQKPLLVSIGYASCHWCHVMARESFQDPNIAALMNQNFVSVKVDREERPDVDAVYMAAVQALTGHGGWPLTVALTPAGEPFYGGTYFPPDDRHGVPSFRRVLGAVTEAWEARRPQVEQSAQELTEALKVMGNSLSPEAGSAVPAATLAVQVTDRLEEAEDGAHAGFGAAPKFPPHESLRLLLAYPTDRNLPLALRALTAMFKGGIRDQLGGGFARYSVDAAWRVPHFEMMLYDNAAMLRNYAVAYSRSGQVALRDVAYDVAGWLMRELAFDPQAGGGTLRSVKAPSRHGEGGPLPNQIGFFSALDADQDGEEGAYYAWSEREFHDAAGAHAELAAAFYGVEAAGVFEGRNVLHQALEVQDLAARFGLDEHETRDRLAQARNSLSQARAQRSAPAIDDKALASWNGLALGALATAGRLLAEPELLAIASANARFLRQHLWHGGRLWHMWRQGQRSVEGLVEDYAFVGLGLLELYRATLDGQHLKWALELAEQVALRFHDPGGGYFSTASDMQRLVVRPKGYVDAATPSENAAAAQLVWWAARYLDDAGLARQARTALQGIEGAVLRAPQAFSSSLRALLQVEGPQREVVLSGTLGEPALEELLARWRRYDDGSALVLLVGQAGAWPAQLPLAQGRTVAAGTNATSAATAYVCEGGVCSLPATTPDEFESRLQAAGFRSATAGPDQPIDTTTG